jgi:chaperonin GroES
MLKPLAKNILVKIKPPEKKGTLILTSTTEKPFEAVVVSKGNKSELEIEIGDVLLLVPYCGSRISEDDEEHLLISEKDVMGVVCDGK